MATSKTILITGAGSGLGEGTAIGLAKLGHQVIAGVQIYPQATELRKKVKALGLEKNLRVERLDILDPYDVDNAVKWDIDILLNDAGIGETGPIFETPLDLIRKNFETNVFAPLALSQKFIAKFIREKKKGKIVFVSSIAGLFTPIHLGVYCATKHALEAVAEALQKELKKYDIQIQTINPGAYFTGFNETMLETSFRWLDDDKNITKKADLKAEIEAQISTPDWRLDPQDMVDAMVKIVPADTGKFRNVHPKFVEDMMKDSVSKAWDNMI